MTLVLALACADGVILASDSQSTIGTTGQSLKGVSDKLYCTWSNVAWGGSGDIGVMQRVDHALRAKFPQPDLFTKKNAHEIRTMISPVVGEAVREIFGGILQLSGQSAPVTAYLFAGSATDRSFIVEIGIDLHDQDHIATGYSAIGSGDIFPYFALVGLRHFNVRNHDLSGASLIAYRIVEDACNAAASGLGLPVQMVEVKKPAGGGEVRSRALSNDELQMLSDKVTEWKELESETLRNYVGLLPAKAEVEPLDEQSKEDATAAADNATEVEPPVSMS